MMTDHLSILERVGKVFFILGILDTMCLLYCILGGVNYSGISITAARVTAWFAALGFCTTLGSLIAIPLLQPMDLLLTQIRLDKAGTAISVAWEAVATALSYWVYTEMRAAPVLEARAAKGLTLAPPKTAFALSVLPPICLAAIMFFSLRGESATNARQLAQPPGSCFKY